MNSVVLMGRLTAKPEIKVTGTGTEYCGFSLAVDRGFKDKNGNKQTDFINCKAWNKNAVFINTYFDKGDGILIKGELHSNKVVSEDGTNKIFYEVNVASCYFPLSKKSSQAEPSVDLSKVDTSDFDEIETNDDDLPF